MNRIRRYRSAATGRWITKAEALRNEKESVHETIYLPLSDDAVKDQLLFLYEGYTKAEDYDRAEWTNEIFRLLLNPVEYIDQMG